MAPKNIESGKSFEALSCFNWIKSL